MHLLTTGVRPVSCLPALALCCTLAKAGCFSCVAQKKIPTKHLRSFFLHLCNNLFPLLLSGQTSAAGLVPDCLLLSVYQHLAKKSWLRPPGSWAWTVPGQGFSKMKASHPVDVLAKVTSGPAAADLSLISAEVSLSHRHMALQGESFRTSLLLALLKHWWSVRNSRRHMCWVLQCICHANATLSTCS